MVTIPLRVSEELAARLKPLQNRLPEIIELGLRQVKAEEETEPESDRLALKAQVLQALLSTGLVSVPHATTRSRTRVRHTPVQASGKPASEIIIEQRRGQL
ncbi:MAG: hypothetical protein JW850_03485 [Thermoflexales bacterium]|nr:hypothetical protein [Thermoflexales bacterium]